MNNVEGTPVFEKPVFKGLKQIYKLFIKKVSCQKFFYNFFI